jgi:hypothetical protein
MRPVRWRDHTGRSMTMRDLRHFRARMQRECRRKYRYRFRPTAEEMAARYRQRVYQCTVCGCFHLTSKRLFGS